MGYRYRGAVVKRIDEIGNGTAIVPAARSLPIAADLLPGLPISLPITALSFPEVCGGPVTTRCHSAGSPALFLPNANGLQ